MRGRKLVPVCVAGANEHCAVHDCKDMDFIGNMFVDDTIRSASCLAEAFKIRWKRPETFFRYLVSKFRKGRKQPHCFAEVPVPAAGDFSRMLSENETDNGHALTVGVSGPFDSHRDFLFDSIPSSIFSISAKDSSSVRHSPSLNCWREISTARLNSAISRQRSTSSQVSSKSVTPIMTVAARPLCVMTMGRCVRAVRSMQSLSVRRHSVNGTTSSSRRGRRMGCDAVRVMSFCSQMEDARIVHYSAHNVNGGNQWTN